jgi:hypothetical protein
LPLTKPSSRPKTTPEPTGRWDRLRANLQAEDNPIAEALARFQRGEIGFAEFHRAMEQAGEESSSPRRESHRTRRSGTLP